MQLQFGRYNLQFSKTKFKKHDSYKIFDIRNLKLKMMHKIITTLTLLLTVMVLKAQNTIEVSMVNFDNDKGTVQVGLYTSAEKFLNKEFKAESSKITNKKATVVFTDVPDGVYAISCFHDEDDNGELNMFLGMMPTEDYGTSNNAPAKFGPPKWKDAKFEIKNKETKSFTIEL